MDFSDYEQKPRKMILMFCFLIHFVGRYLRDLRVESSIFCTALSCFWSAISCGSELIVGTLVQRRHQIGISKTYLGWPYHMHQCVIRCPWDIAEGTGCRSGSSCSWLFPWYFVLWSVNGSSSGGRAECQLISRTNVYQPRLVLELVHFNRIAVYVTT